MIIRLNSEEVQYILDNANRKSVSEICEWIGCTPQTVRYQMHKHGIKPGNTIKFSIEQTFAIQSMIRNGYTYQEIADKLGMTKMSVMGRVFYLRSKGVPVAKVKNAGRRKYAGKRVFRDG